MSSLVLVICRSLNYKPVPLLLSVAICANSGAIATALEHSERPMLRQIRSEVQAPVNPP